jgi:serine phosphatase RsbU (regulator of sigma subunit)
MADPFCSIPLKPDDLDRLAGLTQSLGLAMEFQLIEQQAGEAACRQIHTSLDDVATRGASCELPGYDLAGLFVPGRECGGSFRDFVPRVTYRAGGETPAGGTIVMGEVAGKGIRTALIMADVRLEIRRLLMAGLKLPDILSRINWLIADAGGEGNYVCTTLVDIDSRRHRLTVVNAWHDPLVVRRSAGAVEILGGEQAAVGPPLGIVPDPFFGTITTSLSPGDYVFLTSNAATRNPDFSGSHSVRLRQRAAIHPPSADVALFFFGRKCG